MDQVRVLLVDLPLMLREVVGNVLDGHDGVSVTTVEPFPDSVPETVSATGADLVVLGQDPRSAAAGRDVVRRFPRVPVISMSADARQASVSGLRPFREPLGEVSPDRLVATIRDAVAAAAVW